MVIRFLSNFAYGAKTNFWTKSRFSAQCIIFWARKPRTTSLTVLLFLRQYNMNRFFRTFYIVSGINPSHTIQMETVRWLFSSCCHCLKRVATDSSRVFVFWLESFCITFSFYFYFCKAYMDVMYILSCRVHITKNTHWQWSVCTLCTV